MSSCFVFCYRPPPSSVEVRRFVRRECNATAAAIERTAPIPRAREYRLYYSLAGDKKLRRKLPGTNAITIIVIIIIIMAGIAGYVARERDESSSTPRSWYVCARSRSRLALSYLLSACLLFCSRTLYSDEEARSAEVRAAFTGGSFSLLSAEYYR